MTIDQLKADLQYKADLQTVAAGDRSAMEEGLRNIPVKKIMEAVEYMQSNLLPAVKKKSGNQSADYKFFDDVKEYLLWAIIIADRYESLEGRWARQKLHIQLLLEQLEWYERELQRYCTLEDLTLSQTLDVYAKRVKARAADLLKNKK